MAYYFIVNENGFIIGATEKEGEKTVSDLNMSSFHKPKWSGIEWVEGESEEEKAEREARHQLELSAPSPEELADAELEIKIISLLTELEVIQS